MRIAARNVNSVRQRMPQLPAWLDERPPGVVCLQETKLADAAFAELLGDELGRRGFEVAGHGQGQWNGVAILSRHGWRTWCGASTASRRGRRPARAVAATCGAGPPTRAAGIRGEIVIASEPSPRLPALPRPVAAAGERSGWRPPAAVPARRA